MRFASIVLAAAAVAFAVPAAAEEVTASVGVRYSDLDLSTEAGQQELEARLDRAARNVCGLSEVKTGSRLPTTDARRCMREARSKLDQQFASVIKRHSAGG